MKIVFESKIVFEFSLNAVECIYRRVNCKYNIIPDNILKFLVVVFSNFFSNFYGISCIASDAKLRFASVFILIN